MTQRTCLDARCSNPAAGGAVLCELHLSGGDPNHIDNPAFESSTEGFKPPTITAEEFAEFAKNPFADRADPIPSEETEQFARALRENFIALTRQGFTEAQALKMLGNVIEGIFRGAAG